MERRREIFADVRRLEVRDESGESTDVLPLPGPLHLPLLRLLELVVVTLKYFYVIKIMT